MHESTAILLIDAQTTFVGAMAGASEPLLLRLEALLRFATLLELPVIATLERPVEEKGDLPERLRAVLPAGTQRYEKSAFNCVAEPPIRSALERLGCRHIAVAGAETDVCVQLSVLGLRSAGYAVSVLWDCLFSSEAAVAPAWERMGGAGAMPTTLKTFCYELTGVVRDAWPEAWRRRLATQPELFARLEELPPRE